MDKVVDRRLMDSDILLAEWDRDNAGRTMKAAELRALLASDRRLACLLIARAKVREWDNDGGLYEVARCLGVSMEQGFDLGDDEFLMELAVNAEFVVED